LSSRQVKEDQFWSQQKEVKLDKRLYVSQEYIEQELSLIGVENVECFLGKLTYVLKEEGIP